MNIEQLNIEQKDDKMRRKFKEQDRSRIVQLWLKQDLNYRQIAEQTKASLGTISAEIEKARKAEPDIDSLRELNATLKKSDVPLVDAIRGARLLDRVNELGVSLDGLDSFIKLSETISPERGEEAERFVEASMRFMGLEAQTGKPYEEVVKDFETKLAQVKDIELRVEGLQGEKKRMEDDLSRVRDELRRMVSNKERLERLGLEKVEAVAEFVEDKETMEKQLTKLREGLQDEGKKLESLRAEVERLWDKRVSIQNGVSRLSKLGNILEKGKLTIPCKFCGKEGMFMDVPNRLVAKDAMTRGLVCDLRCVYCGQLSRYSALDVLANVGLLALPEP